MEIAQKLIDEGSTARDKEGILLNPMDGQFQGLDLEYMNPVQAASEEFSNLQSYVTLTHGQTHTGYKGKVSHAFRVQRREEEKRWKDAGYDKLQDGDRLLLWHGSRSTNFGGM